MKKVLVVGIGPGEYEQMTIRAASALREAQVIVGYTVYVDLVREHFPGKRFLTTPMTQEAERCQLAFQEAMEDQTVAMICSGDGGVYGMSGLIYEVGQGYPQVEIEVIPGVTAALSGGAVLGAPLIHDFAVISLSDLLTPWEKIEKRLLAAAEAEALEAAGLTPEMAELALSGCLLDASVTTEALAALEPPEEAHTPQEALETLRVLFRRSRGAYWACAALAGLCALAALLALAGPRGSRLWPFLASAGVGLAAAAMLLYLAWMGRLPARAAMTVLLPAVALALWLVLHGAAGLWTSGSGPRRAAAVAAVLVGVAMLAPCARAAYHSTYNPDPAQGESACTRLERYALAHGDRLFITDLSLGDDRSLFPDWSAGKPANLLLAWGGWNNHSEGYCAAFARFGYAHDGFRIADFADSPLRLVTGAGAQPSDAFMACLNRQLGRPATAVLEAEEGGFAVYAFTTQTADKGDGNP